MFIRWQHYSGAAGKHLRAILLTNRRIDGVHNQRHVAYLGGILENEINKAAARAQFWHKAQTILRTVDGLTGEDHNRLETHLAKRVPRVRSAQIESYLKKIIAKLEEEQKANQQRGKEIAEELKAARAQL
jgi:hypothetical protein